MMPPRTLLECQRRNEKLEAALRRIVEHHGARSELYTNAERCCAVMAMIARETLKS